MQSNRRDHIRRVLASLSTCVKISRVGPEKLVPKFRVRKTALVVFTWPPLSLGVAEKASVVPGPASVSVVALIHSGGPVCRNGGNNSSWHGAVSRLCPDATWIRIVVMCSTMCAALCYAGTTARFTPKNVLASTSGGRARTGMAEKCPFFHRDRARVRR
jgi:hypothetical protein